MAVLKTLTDAEKPSSIGRNNEVRAVSGVWNGSAGLASSDQIQAAWLPPNCEVVDLIVAANECDTNATPTGTLEANIDFTEYLFTGMTLGDNNNAARLSGSSDRFAIAHGVTNTWRKVILRVSNAMATANPTPQLRWILTYRVADGQ